MGGRRRRLVGAAAPCFAWRCLIRRRPSQVQTAAGNKAARSAAALVRRWCGAGAALVRRWCGAGAARCVQPAAATHRQAATRRQASTHRQPHRQPHTVSHTPSATHRQPHTGSHTVSLRRAGRGRKHRSSNMYTLLDVLKQLC
ncbi:MAG: hypothetical protein Pg6A_06520 [Termitinemataceae bacterium]|nr:MAG: hypothetical protein Pg6A_06520 [Termitinemataceae bacterium]